MLGLSVVIPMYNEAENVGPLLEEIQQAMQDWITFELVVVDDGSTDDTYKHLCEFQSTMPQLKILRHRCNYGQSAGIVTGVRSASSDWIATLDGDGQNNPSDIQLLYSALKNALENYSNVLVIGNRKKRQDNWLRRLSSRVAYIMRRCLLRDDCPDAGCGLKLFSKETFLTLPHFNHCHRFLPTLFKRAGGHIIDVPVSHRPRTHGQSKYGIKNRLWVGIVDLIGVMWLMRRPLQPEVADEL